MENLFFTLYVRYRALSTGLQYTVLSWQIIFDYLQWLTYTLDI